MTYSQRVEKGLALLLGTFKSDGCTGIPDGDYRDCCHEHDYYYQHRGRCPTEKISRAEADRRLRACIRDNGEDALWAGIVYFGVRIFGWLWWYRPKR